MGLTSKKQKSRVLSNNLIGGMFGLEEIQEIKRGVPPFISGKELFLVNARSCIYLLVTILKSSKVWLPSFLCDVVLNSLDNYAFDFYGVDGHLQISRDWVNNVNPDDIVVLIDYFGFPLDPSLAKEIKENGAWILEDASQALLSANVGRNSDFVIYSPRKFLGVPDGGILRNNSNLDFSKVKLDEPPQEWWLKAFSATMLRGEFDRHSGNRHWFHLFQETDRGGPVGLFAMSNLSRTLLEYSFDYMSVAQKRIQNYQTLDYYLNKFALFPKLLDGVVPLGFPIRLKNRDWVRQKLFENNIYPPIHWLIKETVPDNFVESHHLADTILTLVCDQRYNSMDMERTAKIILGEGL